MVWFQCESCGENLKKPKLQNHFRGCAARKVLFFFFFQLDHSPLCSNWRTWGGLCLRVCDRSVIRSVTINVDNFQINLSSRACSNREHNNFTEVFLGLLQVPMMVLALLSNVLNSEPFFLLAVWSFFLPLFFFCFGWYF